MGHDIHAYRPGVDRDAEHDEFERRSKDADSDKWVEEYERFQSRTSAAYLRRAMGNPLNKVIYLALDAMECYGGVSGYGRSKHFTLDQLRKAKADILKMDAVPQGAPPGSEEFEQAILAAFPGVVLTGRNAESSASVLEELEPELDFLQKAIECLEATGNDVIEIYFG